MTTFHRYTVRPRGGATGALTAGQVARAYNFPAGDGTGATIALIELGGGFNPSDFPGVEPILVAGGTNTSDGVNGADAEVQLDIGVAQAVAPAAAIKVLFCPNTDAGFLAGIKSATASLHAGDVISISWGAAESEWDVDVLHEYDAAFVRARAKGIAVLVAAGDSGANDGTGKPTCDFPASSPNVVACGGTSLTLNNDGTRATETVWNDNPASSATGGGVSRMFAGRHVPDIAGNADPETGYRVRVDRRDVVIGGTSAVAPLIAGLCALIKQALGVNGAPYDLQNTLLTNPGVCFDVTSGDNGAYRAGPGRDDATGLGVPDGSKLAHVLLDSIPDPIPAPNPQPTPVPPVPPTPAVQRSFPNGTAKLEAWAAKPHKWHLATQAADEWDSSTVVEQQTHTSASALHGDGHQHDAGSGRFVSDEYAREHPETTFRES